MKNLLIFALLIIAVYAKPPFAPLQNEGNQLDNNCVDIGTNCQNWARNGFCTNCNWTCDQRRHYCERTCGFCNPNYVCNTCSSSNKNPFLSKQEMDVLDKIN